MRAQHMHTIIKDLVMINVIPTGEFIAIRESSSTLAGPMTMDRDHIWRGSVLNDIVNQSLNIPNLRDGAQYSYKRRADKGCVVVWIHTDTHETYKITITSIDP